LRRSTTAPRVKPSRRWPVVPRMTDDPDATRARMEKLAHLVHRVLITPQEDLAGMEGRVNA
jgi:hypothetical protein